MAHVNPIQLQKFLKGVDYPASKAELIDNASKLGADENVCSTLQQLPEEEYQTPAEVSQAVGHLVDEGGRDAGREAKRDDGREGAHAPAREAKRDDGREGAHAPAREAKRDAGREGGREPAREAKRDEGREAGREPAPARGADKGHEAKPAAEKHAQPKAHARQHTGSNEFLIEAMQDTMAEIQICEMALEKVSHEEAKNFAQSMIAEHGRMGRDLEKLAEQKKLEVPREIRPEQEMTVDELSSLQGRDFEQRWIQYNIDVHERDIKVFNHYAGEEDDPDIRAMAKHGAEMFRKHLKAAHDVGKKLARA